MELNKEETHRTTYATDPEMTYLDKRLVTVPEPPRCTCRQYEGDDPKCPIHGKKDGQG